MQRRPSQGVRRKEEESLRFLKAVDLWSVKQEDCGDPQASGGKQLWSRPVLSQERVSVTPDSGKLSVTTQSQTAPEEARLPQLASRKTDAVTLVILKTKEYLLER